VTDANGQATAWLLSSCYANAVPRGEVPPQQRRHHGVAALPTASDPALEKASGVVESDAQVGWRGG
jgi:hypothetical protein